MAERVTDRDSIEIYKFDDWEVLMKNGIIIDQDHRIPNHVILDHLGISHHYEFIDEYDWPLLEEQFQNGEVEEIIATVRGAR